MRIMLTLALAACGAHAMANQTPPTVKNDVAVSMLDERRLATAYSFAEKLIAASISDASKGAAVITRVERGWTCGVMIRPGALPSRMATAADADSPERACVRAMFKLNRELAL